MRRSNKKIRFAYPVELWLKAASNVPALRKPMLPAQNAHQTHTSSTTPRPANSVNSSSLHALNAVLIQLRQLSSSAVNVLMALHSQPIRRHATPQKKSQTQPRSSSCRPWWAGWSSSEQVLVVIFSLRGVQVHEEEEGKDPPGRLRRRFQDLIIIYHSYTATLLIRLMMSV